MPATTARKTSTRKTTPSAKPRKPAKRPGFRCGSCGEWHDELATDIGCGLPDAVFELSYLERYRRARYNQDFCTLDGERWFIRCVLPVSFTYRDGFFGWGVWVEVTQQQHDDYLVFFDESAGIPPVIQGTVANQLKGYRATQGLAVRLDMDPDRRPLAYLLPASRHALALEQRKGMDADRHHALILPFGA
ncbi:MAG: DUF2199 domain-containing protein [Acidovorax sp.]|nr:MAG: DUF2199 domain-containing protein [Acidovorax sp.]